MYVGCGKADDGASLGRDMTLGGYGGGVAYRAVLVAREADDGVFRSSSCRGNVTLTLSYRPINLIVPSLAIPT